MRAQGRFGLPGFSVQGLLAVALGGAVGVSLRYWLTLLLPVVNGKFPTAVLMANIAGCFLMGLIVGSGLASDNHHLRLLLLTGFCGGFTTMSAFALEFQLLWRDHNATTASVYLLLSVVGALSSLLTGMWMARVLMRS